MRVRDSEGSVAQVVQPKRLALLAYLALAPRRRFRRREAIVPLFWPELDQEHARGALSQALRYLRRALGEGAIITQGEDEVGLDRAVVGCDAVVFADWCEADRLDEAMAVYQGPFLDALFVTDAAPEFELWVTDERARLSRLATAAAGALAARAERVPDLQSAIEWARRAVTIAPGDEVIAARLIRLVHQSGDRAGALREYERLRQRLKDEFQVAPSRETQGLIGRILGP